MSRRLAVVALDTLDGADESAVKSSMQAVGRAAGPFTAGKASTSASEGGLMRGSNATGAEEKREGGLACPSPAARGSDRIAWHDIDCDCTYVDQQDQA